MIHDERDVRRRRRRMCCEGVQWLKRRVEALHKIGGRALLIALMLSLSASPLEAFVQVKVPSGPVLTKTCGHSRRALQSQPTHAFQPARHPTIPFLPLVETIRQASERTRPIARCPTKYLAFCVLAVWIGGWCFVPRIALAAPENIQQEMRLHSDVHLRPASGGPRQPSVLLAVPGTGGGCEVVAEGILAAEGALASTPPSGRIAGTLLAVVMCAIPLGLPASCFLVAGWFCLQIFTPALTMYAAVH